MLDIDSLRDNWERPFLELIKGYKVSYDYLYSGYDEYIINYGVNNEGKYIVQFYVYEKRLNLSMGMFHWFYSNYKDQENEIYSLAKKLFKKHLGLDIKNVS